MANRVTWPITVMRTARLMDRLPPLVHEAEGLSLPEVARETHLLAEKARAAKLSLNDLEGATCTITNLGIFSVDSFNPTINMLHAAILVVGKIKERPLVERDSWQFDQRFL